MPFAHATTKCFKTLQIATRNNPCKLWAPNTTLLRLASMEKTLLIGDHLIVDRITATPKTSWAFWQHYQKIHRGDIIIFYSPTTPNIHLVKRVIAVPKNRIHLHDDMVYLNRTEQKEPYV